MHFNSGSQVAARLKAKMVVGSWVVTQSWVASKAPTPPVSAPNGLSGPWTDKSGIIRFRSSEVSVGHGLALLDGNLNRPPDGTGGVEPAPSATDARTSSRLALGLGTAVGRSKDACLEALVGSAIPTGAKLDYNQRSG